MAARLRFAPLLAALVMAMGLILLVGRDKLRPISLCIGGCHTHGPPVPLAGPEPKIWHAKKVSVYRNAARLARTQQMAQEYEFNQVVQPGEHSIGRPFKEYVPSQSVMGVDYVDQPFSSTIASVPVQNPSRNWASLNALKPDP